MIHGVVPHSWKISRKLFLYSLLLKAYSMLLNTYMLRSKEFQRMHLPCILQHRETSKCTPVYTEMYPWKVTILLKEQATFIKVIKASITLMWMRCLSLFYTSSENNWLWEWINAHVINTSLARSSSPNEGILVSLSFYKLENVTERW